MNAERTVLVLSVIFPLHHHKGIIGMNESTKVQKYVMKHQILISRKANTKNVCLDYDEYPAGRHLELGAWLTREYPKTYFASIKRFFGVLS